jgi:hypothetical protein
VTVPNDARLRELGLEECEDHDCAGCPACDAMGYTQPMPPPEGWSEAFRAWMRHLEAAEAELHRNPYSCRAMLVQRTAYRRLCELIAERDRLLAN